MRTYKHSNGTLGFRSNNGQFRKPTLQDFGVTGVNDKAITYICNVCGREFMPILHEGLCFCGVNNKRIKGNE